MKPKEKERLVRNRGNIVRSLDVSQIMSWMVKEKALSQKDEDDIMGDPRRRQRAVRFLDILEQKKTYSYEVFLEVLEEYYPHLYLSLVEWEDDDDLETSNHGGDDEWTNIRKTRKYLIQEIDAGNIIGYMTDKDVFSKDEADDVKESKTASQRTEVFLDILETKATAAYDAFLEALGEVYPHIYLMLTDHEDDDLDGGSALW